MPRGRPAAARDGREHRPGRPHSPRCRRYLLLQQLLPHGLAVGDGHRLDFLLPLLCVLDPLEQPVAALTVVPQLAAQLVQLALAQVRLGEDGLPALQQLLDSLSVAVQVHVALAVAPDHPFVDILGLAQVGL